MSDDLYYKTGVLLGDDFFLSTSSTTSGTTGQAANFTSTLTKDGVGNQSVTGITITEVSSSTNPGLYHISCSATTSFVATTGDYSLKITWDTDPVRAVEKTYRVNTSGDPTGTAGNAFFTATSGDGRVTTNGVPLENATIYFQTPSSIPYVSLASDASGLWGPIHFPSNGTWPFEVQLAGYSLLSSSILVSGSTATGPATDLALTAISTASGMLTSSLKTYARYQVRGSVGTAADAKIMSAINDAASMISKARKWSYLKTDGAFTFQAAYATGTITLTNDSTTVTLAGGTFPTWASTTYSAKLLYSGQQLRINTRTSGTVVTLVSPWAGATVTGAGYSVFQDEYALPSDCLIFGKLFPGNGFGWRSDMVSFESLREYQSENNYSTTVPTLHAVHNSNLVIWPSPSIARNWPCIYYRKPAILVNNTDELDFDPLHLDLVQRAIDYQLAVRFGPVEHGTAKECYEDYNKILNMCINNDKENASRVSGGGSRRSSIADRTIPDAT